MIDQGIQESKSLIADRSVEFELMEQGDNPKVCGGWSIHRCIEMF